MPRKKKSFKLGLPSDKLKSLLKVMLKEKESLQGIQFVRFSKQYMNTIELAKEYLLKKYKITKFIT